MTAMDFVLPTSTRATTTAGEPCSYQASAMYQITLNSFEMGKFRYEASAGRNKYVTDSEVELFALFGAVTWNGATRSSDGIKR
jgi:hypothetical protein